MGTKSGEEKKKIKEGIRTRLATGFDGTTDDSGRYLRREIEAAVSEALSGPSIRSAVRKKLQNQ